MNPAPEVDTAARRFDRFGRVLAGATLVMVGLSGPLWRDGVDFPQVPFVAGWPRFGSGLGRVRYALLIFGTLYAASGSAQRRAWAIGLIGFVWAILGDQCRLQPWVQQYVAVATVAVLGGRARALAWARWYAVILYAASGLSKLDAAFLDELGPTFLRAIAGSGADSWPAGVRLMLILAMPAGEIFVALALAIPRSRHWGLAGATVQHLATIAALGPWGLDHSTIVLVWNGAFLVEDYLLFAGSTREPGPGGGPGLAVVGLILALVAGERWGLVDSWPAHALYASHAERAAILWPEAAADALPLPIRQHLGPPDADGVRRLDLTGWSRAGRGVPVYPQNRVAVGIAEALVARYAPDGAPPVRVLLWGRAGLGRTPPRPLIECVGPTALRRRGDRSWINAHPVPGFGR